MRRRGRDPLGLTGRAETRVAVACREAAAPFIPTVRPSPTRRHPPHRGRAGPTTRLLWSRTLSDGSPRDGVETGTVFPASVR